MEPPFNQMDKIIDGLYLGNIEGASNMVMLKKKGITHILQVAAGFQPFFPGEFKYMVINVLDMPQENLMRYFKHGIDFIKGAIRAGGQILVHCYAGVSRSASVVIAYLMKELGLPMLDALTYTRKRRPIVYPNPGFQKQLFEFEKHLKQINQKTMVEYQEKKRQRIIDQQNQLTAQYMQKPRAAASFDGAQKQNQQESAKQAYQMYENNKNKPSQSKPHEKIGMSFNATAKDGPGKFFTQPKSSEASSPQIRPLTQHADQRSKQVNGYSDKTPKQSNHNSQARNFDLSGNQDIRVKKLLSSTETSPQRTLETQGQFKEGQKIKQQMSNTQAGKIMGFQGHVNLESSYNRDFNSKALELAMSMNQKKYTVSNTPTRVREAVNERINNELFRNLPQQQRSTTLIPQKDSKDVSSKNQAAVSQQYFYQNHLDKAGRYSDAAVHHDSKKPPLMMIQKTVPQETQNRGGSSNLQTDARRMAALGVPLSSYMKQGDQGKMSNQHNNIPMHPKLIDPSRKAEIVLTPPPHGGSLKHHQHGSSLNNNSAGREVTQKIILQDKGSFAIKQMPSSQANNTAGMNSFDNRNLREATMRKRY